VASFLGLLFGDAGGATRPGWIEGTVSGLPSPRERVFASAMAVQATTGQIVAAQLLPGGSRYRLQVEPGPTVVVARALARTGRAVSALGPVITVRAGRIARRDLRLPASVSRSSQVGGSVVGIGDIDLASSPVEGYIINQVLQPLQGRGSVLVDETDRVRALIRSEERAAAHGRTEPFRFRPLKPQYRISGDSGLVDGKAYFELSLKDVDTGELLAHRRESGKPTERYGYGLLLFQVTRLFRADMLKAIARAESGGPASGGPRVPVSISLEVLCACGPGSAGTLTADPPGLKSFENEDRVKTRLGFTLPAGVTVKVEANPAPGYYLVHVTGTCVFQPRGTTQPKMITLVSGRRGEGARNGACGIVPVSDGDVYKIGAQALFHRCPSNPSSFSPAPNQYPFLQQDCLGSR
jgi:hypothetical protein